MSPINFEGTNLELTKPEGMTDEECLSIRAYRGVNNNGVPFIMTAWQPNAEDIKAIQEGCPIFISTLGESFAPMYVFTLDENNQTNTL